MASEVLVFPAAVWPSGEGRANSPAKKPFSQARCSRVNGAFSGTQGNAAGLDSDFIASRKSEPCSRGFLFQNKRVGRGHRLGCGSRRGRSGFQSQVKRQTGEEKSADEISERDGNLV